MRPETMRPEPFTQPVQDPYEEMVPRYRIQISTCVTEDQCMENMDALKKKKIRPIMKLQWHYTGKTCLWCCRVMKPYATEDEAKKAAKKMKLCDWAIVKEA